MMSASERVRVRIRQLVDQQPRGFKKKIHEALGVAPATVTPWVSGEREPPLDHLEKICRLLNVRIAEVVAEEGSTVKELNADEAFILRALRNWPLSVTRALASFVAFFADEEPVAKQTRAVHEWWRHMNPAQRETAAPLMQLIAEGVIGPDLLGPVLERLRAGQLADAIGRERRKRTTRDDDKQP